MASRCAASSSGRRVSPFRSSSRAEASARGSWVRSSRARLVAAADSLERLDPFAGDFRVGLRFPEALARRVECDALRLHQRHQVGEPALGAGDVVVQHHKEAVRKILRERSEHHGVARSVKAAQRAACGGPGQIAQQLLEFTQRLQDREQLWERHGAK